MDSVYLSPRVIAASVLLGVSVTSPPADALRSPSVQLLELDPMLATEMRSIAFDGLALLPDGSPAVSSVVVTSAGGQATTNSDGQFRVVVDVANGVEFVRVTAVSSQNRSLIASRRVAVLPGSTTSAVGTLNLTSSSDCDPRWLPTFGGRPGAGGPVRSFVAFDSGYGPELYVGGDSGVAKWNGAAALRAGSISAIVPPSYAS